MNGRRPVLRVKFKFTFNRTFIAAIFGAALATGIGFFIGETRLGDPLERGSYNLSHTLRGNARALEAQLVYLDEPSYKALGQPLNEPWDRSLHAKLIDRLTAAGAKVIVFDIVFVDPMTNHPGSDAQFADAMHRSGRVILAADNVDQGRGMHTISKPFDLLDTNAADVGSAEMLPEADGVIRLHTPEDQMYSLSWAAAAFLKADVTTRQGESTARRWVHYYGQPGWLPGVSYFDALDPKRSADEDFRGKAVFVGGRLLTKMAADRKDEFPNPYSFWNQREIALKKGTYFSAGVEVQATKFLNLIRGDWLRRPGRWIECFLVAIIGVVSGFGLVQLRPFAAAGVALVGMALIAIVFQSLFAKGMIWFPWLLLAIQIVFALAWSVLYNSFQYYAEKRMMEHTLSLYLSPKLVRKFAHNPKLLKPGAEKQVLTLFFTDIENFTTMSQGMDSDELAKFMNGYFQNIVSNCIHSTDGTVVKYIGDAVFSFWNAPEAQPDHAARACDAALRLCELPEITMHGKPVRTRVGIHTGEANVGNFGSVERVDYTALGEHVNLASRLEGLNKFLGTQALISAETRSIVGDSLVTRRVGLFTLKGFDKSVEAFELIGRAQTAESTKPWREAFDQALRNYEEGDFELAMMGFRGVMEMKPADGPTKFYMERIEDASREPLEGDWTGVTTLKEK